MAGNVVPDLSSTPKIRRRRCRILAAGGWGRGNAFGSTPAPRLGTGGRGGGQCVFLASGAGVPAPGGCEVSGLLRILRQAKMHLGNYLGG